MTKNPPFGPKGERAPSEIVGTSGRIAVKPGERSILGHEESDLLLMAKARAVRPDTLDETTRFFPVECSNNRLDAFVTGFFALLILLLLAEAAWEWYRILGGKRAAELTETPYVRSRWVEEAT